MAKAPRKYLDRDRTVVNPDWREYQEGLFQGAVAVMGGGTLGTYEPDAVGKGIPPEGAWVRVVEVPHTELSRRFQVPLLSIWRARPHTLNSGGLYGRYPKQAVIQTPGGDLHLWAHEYVLVDDVRPYVGAEPDVMMHSLGGQPVLDTDALFYLQSRGISQHDAALLLVNDLRSQDVLWFEMHPAYVEMFAGVGVPLWRHVALDRAERRRAGEPHRPFRVSLSADERLLGDTEPEDDQEEDAWA
jgi:hypothetical protein